MMSKELKNIQCAILHHFDFWVSQLKYSYSDEFLSSIQSIWGATCLCYDQIKEVMSNCEFYCMFSFQFSKTSVQMYIIHIEMITKELESIQCAHHFQ